MTVRSLKDGTLKVADNSGTGGANVVTVSVEEGDFSYTERTPVNIISDRGVLDHARKGNEEPVDFSFTVLFESFKTEGSPTVYEALKGIGDATGWTSATSDTDAYGVQIELTITDPGTGSNDETVTLNPVFPEEIQFQEGDPTNTLSVSGRAKMTAPTIA